MTLSAKSNGPHPLAVAMAHSIWLWCALDQVPLIWWYWHHPNDNMPWFWWGMFTSPAYILAVVACAVHEARDMCARCMEKVPADAAIRAQPGGRDYRWLWIWHHVWRIVLGFTLVITTLRMTVGLWTAMLWPVWSDRKSVV